MKRLINILIPLLMFFAGTLLMIRTIYVDAGNNFTAVNIGHGTSQIDHIPGLLIKGDKVVGIFTAQSDNLGGLSLRFDNHNKMSTDSIVFRIKEISSPSWFYENVYKVDQFQPKELFPFGFPLINNSRDKHYVFEIESARGTESDAISISPIYPMFKSKYQFFRSDLVKPSVLFDFVKLKVISIFTDIQFILILLTYLTPFFIFLVFIYMKNKRFYIILPLFMMTIVTLHLIFKTNVGFLVPEIIVFCWIEIVLLFKISSYFGALFVLFFTLLTAVFTCLNQLDLSQNAGSWVFIFLGITIIQGIIELNMKPRKIITLDLGAITLRIN